MALSRVLIGEISLTNRVVTGDAKFCQRDLSQLAVRRGGAYFWVVKDNQPTLRDDIATVFLSPPPGERLLTAVSRTTHGDRTEVRTLSATTALNGYLDWPHVAQVCRIERQVTRKQQTTTEIAYAITSLSPETASPAQLAAFWRGHWGIENRLHWVRDVTFGEDASQVRTGSGPQVIAALRNTTIAILRRAGHTNIAAALRTYAARPADVLALVGLTL